MQIADVYLGDGVYASFDGFAIVLDLRGQAAVVPVTKIVLEPEVLAALWRYVAAIQGPVKEVQS